MPDQNDRSLVRQPSGQVAKLPPGGQQIVSEMMDHTLELAREKQEISRGKRYKIGEHELCEPDYLQVLEWAKLAETQPDVFLDEILDVNYRDTNSIVDGKIQTITLDLANHLNLKDFSFSYILEIKYLVITDGALEQIDLSKACNLRKLACCDNQLSQLDVSNLTELKLLWCYDNQLTELDVSNLTELKELKCSENQLTELDVSNLTQLESLYCYENQLTELDVSNNTELKELWCEENQLAELDVSFVNHLECVFYDNDSTKLIKRDDQNF